jgi:alpha-L-fucosidase 2
LINIPFTTICGCNFFGKWNWKKVQHLLLAGKNEEAQALMEKHFIAKGAGSGNGSGANDKYGCYQSLGDLYINWQDSAESTAHYSRRLDVEHADAIVKFLRGDKLVKEEVFSDFVHDIIWIKLTSSKKGGINVSLSLSRKENAVSRTEANRWIMSGQLPSGKDKGMQFATVLEAVLPDGKVLPDGNTLVIKDALLSLVKRKCSQMMRLPLQKHPNWLLPAGKPCFKEVMEAPVGARRGK